MLASIGTTWQTGIAALGFGVALGLGQAVVIHQVLPQISRPLWIIATAIGWWTVILVDSTVGDIVWQVGGLLGIAQWLVVRGKLRGASWWIVASIVGVMVLRLEIIHALAVFLAGWLPWPVVAGLICAVHGALYALVTAIVLVILLMQEREWSLRESAQGPPPMRP
jgi:hypothetical protein